MKRKISLRRLLIISLAAVVLLSALGGCGSKSAPTTVTTPAPASGAKAPGTEAPGAENDVKDAQDTPVPQPEEPEAETPAPEAETPAPSASPDAAQTPIPTETPAASAAPAGAEPSCTFSISCATILDNMELCDPAKTELVPSDGWILAPTTVAVTEGESVFDVLKRVCADNGVLMEFSNTPGSGSAYIEGIANLYEFDVGELSGWMYKVNGWFPNYGCSLYSVANGDEICWVYTCDLGEDVGGGYSAG